MDKRIISANQEQSAPEPQWLPIDAMAHVEITSESPAHPIEAALAPGWIDGWRASAPGTQTIRLKLDQPRALRQVRIVVEERERSRTQQFVLRAANSDQGPWQEIARQQFNFSPTGATVQEENYRLSLPSVTQLEITIVPDISGGDAHASIKQLRLAE